MKTDHIPPRQDPMATCATRACHLEPTMNDDPSSFYSCSTAKAIGQVMTTRRRCILAGAAAPFVFAHLPAPAQEKFVEGKHYTKLSRVQPTRDPKLVEVIEFFAYGCSHCNAFEPALDAWQRKLPRDVLFRRTPVAFRDGPMVLQQKLFLAIESLDLVPGGHPNSPSDGHPKFPHPGVVAMTC